MRKEEAMNNSSQQGKLTNCPHTILGACSFCYQDLQNQVEKLNKALTKEMQIAEKYRLETIKQKGEIEWLHVAIEKIEGFRRDDQAGAKNGLNILRDKLSAYHSKLGKVREALEFMAEFSPHCCEDCPCDEFRRKSQEALQSLDEIIGEK